MTTEDVLKQWYKAHFFAQGNPQLLLSANSAEEAIRFGGICASRMRDCTIADNDLFMLEKMPPIVKLFIQADKDYPDCSCRYSSKGHHPECEVKIKEWFALNKALMTYIFERYFQNTPFMLELENGKS